MAGAPGVLLALVAMFAAAGPVGAQLSYVETANVKMVSAGAAQDYLVPHAGRCFENALAFHRRMFGYTSDEKITVLLQDFSDYGSGGAWAVPKNGVSISIAPFSYVYETRPANERMNWIMNHELAHIVASDKASGSDRFFRSLFLGKPAVTADQPLSMAYSYLATPRWYSPRWYHEGIAVFMETWMAGGLGRALGAYDEMVFRTMVRDSAYIYDMVGLESEGTAKDFQVGAVSYLYGTRFMSYLALEYGPQKLVDWVSRTRDSKRYFASQFKRVYGVSVSRAWSQWIDWERRWQEANLGLIRTCPMTPYREISERGLGSVSRAYFDPATGRLYAAILYPGETAHIAAIDLQTGRADRICDVSGPALYYVTSLAFDPETAALFYTTDNDGWRDLVEVDTKSGRQRLLSKDVRAGDLAFNPSDKSLWGVRHYNGISTIVRIVRPYAEWDQVCSFPYGTDVYDLDLSPEGRTLSASLTEVSGRQQLVKFDVAALLSGSAEYDTLFDFENSSAANFVFSPDGKYLTGSSYYTGVSNIYRYDLERRDMEILTNCETGFFRPVPVSPESILVFHYSGDGFVPCMISARPAERVRAIKYLGQEVVTRHPVVESWTVGSPASVNIDSLVTQSGEYSPVRNVGLASAYPAVEGYKHYAAAGMRLELSEPLGFTGLDLTASYTPERSLPEEERLHLRLKCHHWNWGLSVAYNGADFYDLFGPTKVSRKGHSVGLSYKRDLIYEPPKTLDCNFYLAGYGGLEELPDYQSVASSFDRFMTFDARLDLSHLRSTLGAVDQEKGYRWQVVSTNNYVRETVYPRLYTTLDYGLFVPVSHSPVWLRTSAGYSFGDRDEPFANFYFGGFGNNWIDHQQISRFREYYSFPGAEISSVGGTNYAKVLVEWLLPPIAFKRVGFTSAYLRWASVSLFSGGLATDVDSRAHRRSLLSLGGQVNLRLITFSLLKSTFSAGCAVSLEKDRRHQTEYMVSLKIL